MLIYFYIFGLMYQFSDALFDNEINLECRGEVHSNVTLTAYYPDYENEKEYKDKNGSLLCTLQDYMDDRSEYVTLAMDSELNIPYGTVVCIPELNLHFGHRIRFEVRDTSADLKGENFTRADICVRTEIDSYDIWVNRRIIICVVPTLIQAKVQLPKDILQNVVNKLEPKSKILEIVRIPIVHEIHYVQVIPTVPQYWFENGLSANYRAVPQQVGPIIPTFSVTKPLGLGHKQFDKFFNSQIVEKPQNHLNLIYSASQIQKTSNLLKNPIVVQEPGNHQSYWAPIDDGSHYVKRGVQGLLNYPIEGISSQIPHLKSTAEAFKPLTGATTRFQHNYPNQDLGKAPFKHMPAKIYTKKSIKNENKIVMTSQNNITKSMKSHKLYGAKLSPRPFSLKRNFVESPSGYILIQKTVF